MTDGRKKKPRPGHCSKLPKAASSRLRFETAELGLGPGRISACPLLEKKECLLLELQLLSSFPVQEKRERFRLVDCWSDRKKFSLCVIVFGVRLYLFPENLILIC